MDVPGRLPVALLLSLGFWADRRQETRGWGGWAHSGCNSSLWTGLFPRSCLLTVIKRWPLAGRWCWHLLNRPQCPLVCAQVLKVWAGASSL